MRFFYAKPLKKYIIIGALLGFFIMLIARIFLPVISVKELELHVNLRYRLGYPFAYYSANAILMMTLLYQIFYLFIGGILGYILFTLINRRKGFTLLTSTAFNLITSIMLILILYAFIHVDCVNKYQPINLSVTHKITFLSNITDNLKKIFLPSFSFFKPSTIPGSNNRNYAGPTLVPPHYPDNPVQNPPVYVNPVNPINPQPQPPSAQELFSALNNYRQRNGKRTLNWEGSIANYAQNRANLFTSLGDTDNHTGFENDLKNGLYFQLGFYGFGENSSYGYITDAKTIIESHFGSSPAHNENMLNEKWEYGGIGINGSAIDIIFAGWKIKTVNQ